MLLKPIPRPASPAARRLLSAPALCLIAAFGISACGGSAPSAAPPRGVIAIVHGQVITEPEVRQYADYALSFYAWAYGTDIGGSAAVCTSASRNASCVRVRRQALLRLIEEHAISTYAAAHHIALTASDRALVAGQVSALASHDTTASQLLEQHRISREFIAVLLGREALVRKVEQIVTASRAGRGEAYHLRQYSIPRLPGSEDARVHKAAIDLATDGSPIPAGARIRTSWVAPFRVKKQVLAALALVRPGQFVGPFRTATHYLVVEYLGKGIHAYARPARLALETKYFKQWLTSQVRAVDPRCFDTTERSVACPSADH